MSMQKDPDRNEINFLNKFLDVDASRKRVLEIGCGEGRLTWQYARKPGFTVGIDVDSDALRVAAIDIAHELQYATSSEVEFVMLPRLAHGRDRRVAPDFGIVHHARRIYICRSDSIEPV